MNSKMCGNIISPGKVFKIPQLQEENKIRPNFVKKKYILFEKAGVIDIKGYCHHFSIYALKFF